MRKLESPSHFHTPVVVFLVVYFFATAVVTVEGGFLSLGGNQTLLGRASKSRDPPRDSQLPAINDKYSSVGVCTKIKR